MTVLKLSAQHSGSEFQSARRSRNENRTFIMSQRGDRTPFVVVDGTHILRVHAVTGGQERQVYGGRQEAASKK
jgi:hypothetical protein